MALLVQRLYEGEPQYKTSREQRFAMRIKNNFKKKWHHVRPTSLNAVTINFSANLDLCERVLLSELHDSGNAYINCSLFFFLSFAFYPRRRTNMRACGMCKITNTQIVNCLSQNARTVAYVDAQIFLYLFFVTADSGKNTVWEEVEGERGPRWIYVTRLIRGKIGCGRYLVE